MTSTHPISFRDALLRHTDRKPLSSYYFVVPEDVQIQFPNVSYSNWLDFEVDVAEACELTLVFSEAHGSIAELGAFCMVPEIARKILVFIDDKHHSDESFITLGVLRSLVTKFGSNSVCVIHRETVGIRSVRDIKDIILSEFLDVVCSAVSTRVSTSKSVRIDTKINGHLIKLIVGLIQHYTALTFEEIEVHLFALGANQTAEKISNLLLCAKILGWITEQSRGIETYYLSTAQKEAISFKLRKGIAPYDRLRWRTDIVSFWEQTDSNRFKSIQDLRAGRISR